MKYISNRLHISKKNRWFSMRKKKRLRELIYDPYYEEVEEEHKNLQKNHENTYTYST